MIDSIELRYNTQYNMYDVSISVMRGGVVLIARSTNLLI